MLQGGLGKRGGAGDETENKALTCEHGWRQAKWCNEHQESGAHPVMWVKGADILQGPKEVLLLLCLLLRACVSRLCASVRMYM